MSESTFFRYFPTKEDVVLWDDFDPRIVEAFLARPPEHSVARALRDAFREVMAGAPKSVMVEARERMALVLSAPPLRATLLDGFRGPMAPLGEAVARRTGRGQDDPAVRVTVGALVGVGLSVMLAAAEDPESDMVTMFDEALALLDNGLPL